MGLLFWNARVLCTFNSSGRTVEGGMLTPCAIPGGGHVWREAGEKFGIGTIDRLMEEETLESRYI